MKKKLASRVIVFGVALTLLCLLAGLVVPGLPGFQVLQILGSEVGVLIVFLGVTLRILQKKQVSFYAVWGNLKEWLYNLPPLAWVMLGTLPTFVLFFLVPAFFNPAHRIQYPTEYILQIVPGGIDPLGIDAELRLYATGVWLQSQRVTQYIFAPIAHILFAPMLLLGYPASYYILTFITLISYLISGLLSILMMKSKNKSVIAFIAAISIFSYGMVFEFERGQTYTFSFMLCMLAIYLFHWQRDFRWLAYLLFCVSVQLKYSPALLVMLFVDDWRDWRNTLLRFAGLGTVNFLLLFLFGFSYFFAFANHMLHSAGFGEAMVSNHSIYSFVHMLSSPEWGMFRGESAQWVEHYSGWISGLLYVYFAVCFAVALVGAWARNRPGFEPNLLLVCTIGILILPSVNHDYTLPILTMPFALAAADWHAPEHRTSFAIGLTMIASFAYSAILIPYVFKPLFLWNSLPLLFVVLTVTTLQNLLPGKTTNEL